MASYIDNPDPRSYEAAVQQAAVNEAERIVLRAQHGPSSHELFMRALFRALDPNNQKDEE